MSDDKLQDLKHFQDTVSKNILFILKRSKNGNIVVYEALYDGDKLKSDKPVDVYWLDVDPKYVEANRKKGKMDDRVELNAVEKKIAYGLSAKAIDGEDGAYEITLVAFKKRKLKVYVKDGQAISEMEINGKPANLKKIDIKSKEGWVKATVIHVDLYGYDIESGELVTERILP